LTTKEDLAIVIVATIDVEIKEGVLQTDGWTDRPGRNPTVELRNVNLDQQHQHHHSNTMSHLCSILAAKVASQLHTAVATTA